VGDLACPYPVIYTRKALGPLKPGGILEVLTDNPPSCENIPGIVEEDDHEVIGVTRVEEGVYYPVKSSLKRFLKPLKNYCVFSG